MICGVVGLVVSLLYANLWSRNRAPAERTVVRDRDVY
jgi:hypothetical protein